MSAPIELTRFIRNIPDFPKPGILFRDITPLLGDYEAFAFAIDELARPFIGKGVDTIAAAEARGFIFGGPLALKLGAGFVPIRKPGKLPHAAVSIEYQLEYGADRLEVHSDAAGPGRRILLVDDVLATGGTMKACLELVRRMGAEVVGCAFLIELDFLKGRDRLPDCPIHSVLRY